MVSLTRGVHFVSPKENELNITVELNSYYSLNYINVALGREM